MRKVFLDALVVRKQRLSTLLIVVLAGATILAFSHPAWATTIIVDETTCTLVDAITAANTDSAVGGCDSGSGPDTIELSTDVTLTEANNGGPFNPTGLPVVQTVIALEGGGLTIERDAAAPVFRLFVVAENGTLSLNDVTLSNGKTVSGDCGPPPTESSQPVPPPNCTGGGILNHGSVTMTNSTLLSNSSTWIGGGIFIGEQSVASLANSTVSGNSARYGGGIAVVGGELEVVNSMLSSNSTSVNLGSTAGGGIGVFGGTVSVTSSTLASNSAYHNPDMHSGSATGGGIAISSGSVNVANSTLSGNSAFSYYMGEEGEVPTGAGGGISISGGSLSLSNTTLSGNSANSTGGGIGSYGASSILANNIVANSPSGGNCQGDIADSGNNFSGDDTCGPGFADITPGTDFDVALADNGGATQTHALLAGSVAIDAAGDCGLDTDQRDYPRDDGACDSGSFEFQGGDGGDGGDGGVPAVGGFGTVLTLLAVAGIGMYCVRREAH